MRSEKDFMDNTTSAIILLNSYNDIAFFVYRFNIPNPVPRRPIELVLVLSA
jgi:hypothetical protein